MIWYVFTFVYLVLGAAWLFYIGHMIRKREQAIIRRAVMREFLQQENGAYAEHFQFWYDKQWADEDKKGGFAIDRLHAELVELQDELGSVLFGGFIFMAGLFWLPLTLH